MKLPLCSNNSERLSQLKANLKRLSVERTLEAGARFEFLNSFIEGLCAGPKRTVQVLSSIGIT